MNKMSDQQLTKPNDVFNSKLLIDVSKDNRDSIDNMEPTRLSIDQQGNNQTKIKECIPKDLLERLDYTSPYVSIKGQNINVQVQMLEDTTPTLEADVEIEEEVIPNNQSNQKICNNKFMLNNKQGNVIKKKKPKKKKLNERDGDWTCFKCKNLNFAFRSFCNRCQMLKDQSDYEHDAFMNNLLQMINQNESLRQQENK